MTARIVPDGRRRARGSVAGLHPRTYVADVRLRDVLEAKIRPPSVRPGVVERPGLVSRLRRGGARTVTIVAPAGWGKTTLMTQWAAAESRPVAWVSVDAYDDALTFLKHVLAAIARVAPVERRLMQALDGPRPPAWPVLLSRAARTVCALPQPLLLAIDNADLLRAREARRVYVMLIAEAPPGSTIALAARTAVKLPVAGPRGAGSVQGLGIDELALADKDARHVLETASANLTASETAELLERCGGWPAALYLASVAVSGAAPAPYEPLVGSDRDLADYMRAEYLSQLRPQERQFALRTAILEELTAPLCDAVLRARDSESYLRTLERLQFVIRTGAEEDRFRYHRLLRDLLLHDLTATAPGAVAGLHRRAAAWYRARKRPASALRHAQAAGDSTLAAAMLDRIALSASSSGHVQDMERALAHFDQRHLLDDYPAVAVDGSWVHAYRGRTAEAERWLAAAERGTRRRASAVAAVRPKIGVVRAALCRRGPRQMFVDATGALGKLSRASPWYPPALHLRASAVMLLGALDDAETLLMQAGSAAAAIAPETRMIALSQLSFLARRKGDAERAHELADDACAIAAELEGYPTAAIALAASAQAALHHGRWAEAREHVTAAEPLTAFLTETLPWLAVSTRVALGRIYLTLRDHDGARMVADEVDRLLDARPRLGILVDQAQTLRAEVSALPGANGAAAPAGLTPAECRLVPLLATHLSFREIADELRVSRNTVKTQAISIYRKLGVTGRSDAIAAAAKLGIAVRAAA